MKSMNPFRISAGDYLYFVEISYRWVFHEHFNIDAFTMIQDEGRLGYQTSGGNK